MKLRPSVSGKNFQPRMLVLFALAAVFVLILCAPLAARADSIDMTFVTPDPVYTPPGSAPWATLNLTLNPDQSITADFTMTPGFGFSSSFLTFNVVGSTDGLTAKGLPDDWALTLNGGGGCSGSSFGCFDAWVKGHSDVTSLDFTLSRTGGFSSVYDLMKPSVDGSPDADWAAVVFQGDGYGFAAAEPNQPTPEPSTFLMLGSGILGVFGMLRRKLL